METKVAVSATIRTGILSNNIWEGFYQPHRYGLDSIISKDECVSMVVSMVVSIVYSISISIIYAYSYLYIYPYLYLYIDLSIYAAFFRPWHLS